MKDNAALRPTVLVVDPDAEARAALVRILAPEAEVLSAATGAEALKECQDSFVEVVFVACGADAPEGAALLEQVAAHWPETVRIATRAAEAPRLPEDLYQVCTDPAPGPGMARMMRNAVQLFRVRRENDRMSFEMRFLSRKPALPDLPHLDPGAGDLGFEAILRSPGSAMAATVAEARHLASFDVPILLTGAPGTGKALMAKAIHGASLRADRPFCTLDCAGLPGEAIRADLCGTRNGNGPRAGLFQKAARGTLFLNGIDTLDAEMQLWLSRVLRGGAFPLPGSGEVQRLDCRLVAGSHADLRIQVAAGLFRTDLFHAVALGQVTLPALRDRIADLPLLAERMLHAAAERHGKPVRGLTAEALGFLAGHDWPGNLPELENEVTRMLIFSQAPDLGPELISRHILQGGRGPQDPALDAIIAGDGPLKDRVEEVERRILREVLTRLKWNKSRAASELGLSRVGLRAKLDRYGLVPGGEELAEEG